MSKTVRFACNCESAHYVGCPNADNLVVNDDGTAALQGYAMSVTQQPGTPVEVQARDTCRRYCDTKCTIRKGTPDKAGYTRRAIYDAMGWDVHSTCPLARWALVGPPIVPGHSVAATLIAAFFILCAIAAAMQSGTHADPGLSSVRNIFNALVAAYFGPFYLGIASMCRAQPAVARLARPIADGFTDALIFLALVGTIFVVLEATRAIRVQPDDK
jgi:hypothetical protein